MLDPTDWTDELLLLMVETGGWGGGGGGGGERGKWREREREREREGGGKGGKPIHATVKLSSYLETRVFSSQTELVNTLRTPHIRSLLHNMLL